jgi:hypothetical protein
MGPWADGCVVLCCDGCVLGTWMWRCMGTTCWLASCRSVLNSFIHQVFYLLLVMHGLLTGVWCACLSVCCRSVRCTSSVRGPWCY